MTMSTIWARLRGWVEHLVADRPAGGYGTAHERPAYGHGRFGRPLWTERDRDAERIRKVLRRAGLREFTDRHAGFAVEGEGDPFYVACVGVDAQVAAGALTGAGYTVTPDDDDQGGVLVVRRPR